MTAAPVPPTARAFRTLPLLVLLATPALAQNGPGLGNLRYPQSDHLESIARIGGVRIPLMIVHGERDRVIPPEFGRELRVVRFQVELAVLGEHEAVDRQIPGTDPLAVIFHLGATVVGFDGVSVQIEYHSVFCRLFGRFCPAGRSRAV